MNSWREDTARYKAALEKTGGVFGGTVEPVHRFHEAVSTIR